MQHLEELEAMLFEQRASAAEPATAPLIFILGSPRTGSTLLYQFIINTFDVFYISNLINDGFATHPVVGAALDVSLNPRKPVPYENRFGKTESCFGPSEASLVMRHWFGGEHPSQTQSTTVIPERRDHMLRSVVAMHAISGRPIVIKNAWNCFRIRELSTLFPSCAFLWIRRDIEAAAASDLASRYAHGSPNVWNSATTANYLDLQKRPYWEQVVEQQYEYNRAIRDDLHTYAEDRFVEFWYEDLCANTTEVLGRCQEFFDRRNLVQPRSLIEQVDLKASEGAALPDDDRARICAYVAQQADGRLGSFLYRNGAGQARNISGT